MGALMESYAQPPPRGPGPWGQLAGLVEILPVAVLGQILAYVLLGLLGISGSEILQDPRLVFIFLTVDATATLVLIMLLLWARGEGPGRIGWRVKGWRSEVLWGIGVVPLLFASTLVVGLFFRAFLPQYVSERNPLLELLETERDLVLFLISSVYVGGIKEEFQRAFALERFEEYLGGILQALARRLRSASLWRPETWRRLALAGGLLAWTVVFGLGHLIQGVDNATGAAVLGLLFGVLYIWRRILVAPVVAHALYDVAALLIYWNLVRGNETQELIRQIQLAEFFHGQPGGLLFGFLF